MFVSLNHDARPLGVFGTCFFASNKLGHLSNFGAAFLQAKLSRCLNLHAAEKASSKEDSDLALRFGELEWL
jgi:hypothetical protein